MNATIRHITYSTLKGKLRSLNMLSTGIIHCAFLLFFILYSLFSSAQDERSLTREGNKLFDKQKYADAEVSYKKALEKKNNFPEAIFNLGDAMYQQGRYDDASKQFELASKTLADPKLKAQSYHNMGNCQLKKDEYEKAVDAYKQALKLNPTDKDTKYNLAYANAKLKEKQKQDRQNKNNKNNKNDKDKDKKDQNKDNKDNKGNDKKDDKGQQDKDKQGNKENKPAERPKLSKEQAEKLLEALKAEEQKAQDKMQKKTAKPVDVKIEKDW